jgi:Leucyl/phenylalanyl-tRNA protein transferase
MFLLNKDIAFPPVEMADADGLLAIGGDLSTERLLLAYKSGIFPWYNQDEIIQWWSPDPRFVLWPAELKVSRSMQTVLHNGRFRFTINKNFTGVIENCKTIARREQDGTWIQKKLLWPIPGCTNWAMPLVPKHGKTANWLAAYMAYAWAIFFLAKVCLAKKVMPANLRL